MGGCGYLIGGRVVPPVKYYLFSGRRVAVRQGCSGAVTWFYHDHLGSTVATSAGESTRYWPYGSRRTGAVGTPYRYTGQELDSASGLYYYVARWYDPALGRFLQPDTIVPEPGNPQSLNRFAYCLNNPVRYVDPTGHWPDWYQPIRGAIVQYANDMTLGFAGEAYRLINSLSIDEDPSHGFQQGREYGRAVSKGVATAQTLLGLAAAGLGAAMGPPTVALTTAGALPSGGVLAVGGAVALTAEGVMVVAGTAQAAYGTAVLAYAQNHHIASKANWIRDPKWSKRFQELFDKGGLRLDDEINKVRLPGHKGPHSQAYHEWVYRRLTDAIEGVTGQPEIRTRLVAELQAIASELQVNPGLLNMGR
jgi:RHS repeat-associated protein